MDSPSHLRAILRKILDNGTLHGEPELFEELTLNRDTLLRLFDVGGKNANERRELESGRIIINGKSSNVNAEFIRQVVFLSDQLDASEHHVATLFDAVTKEKPNTSLIDQAEATVARFHTYRRDIADSLLYILQASVATEKNGAPEIYLRVFAYAHQYLLTKRPGMGDNLASRLLKQIESNDRELTKALVAKQNAVSQTTVPSAQGISGSLGADIMEARCSSLRHERRTLAELLYLICRLGYLGSAELRKMVDWLASGVLPAATFYILTATLAALDPIATLPGSKDARAMLSNDAAFLDYMKLKINPATAWKEEGLKSLVLLKWTLFLTEARHRDPSLENRDGFRADQLETQIWNSVQGDVFPYASRLVSQLHRGSATSVVHLPDLPLGEHEQQRDILSVEFKRFVLEAFDVLVRSLIRHASSELRKIKQRQEDIVLAGARMDRSRLYRSSAAQTSAQANDEEHESRRNDIAAFFSFVGVLYEALPPEHALQFWGASPIVEDSDPHRSPLMYLIHSEVATPRLPPFLQWSAWSTQARDVEMSTALYNMLSGLANGQQCSEMAYNFVTNGGALGSSPAASDSVLSWSAIFGLLESWAVASANPKPVQALPVTNSPFSLTSRQWHVQTPTQPQSLLGPREVFFAQSFLRFLSTVVTYSIEVRRTLASHAHFRAIPTLVSLLPLGIPLELKGAIFDALSSFAEPSAGGVGAEISRAIWNFMERMEVINVRSLPTGSAIPVKGLEMELEEVEAVHKIYPATIPFIRLLATLIHTPKRIPFKERGDEAFAASVPEMLGQGHRLPGIGPYVSFVVDNVFANISAREYARQQDRWIINDLSLCFVERCLAGFNLEALLNLTERGQLTYDVIASYVTHPGFDIVKRLLSSTPLQSSILSYIVDGVDGFDKNLAQESKFHSTIVRVLRIVHRALEIQDIFLDVLVPLLSEFDIGSLIGPAPPRSYFTAFDQVLFFNPQHVPALATYVTFPGYPELNFLSVKILAILAQSSSLTGLTTLVERSADSDRIIHGYYRLLSAESSEDPATAEIEAEEITGAGALDVVETVDLSQAARLAVMDLFIQGTLPNRPRSNFAHFLLFGSADARQIEDPHALGAHTVCIHAIIELLNRGVPRLTADLQPVEPVMDEIPLFVDIPALAERCCRIIHQLCIRHQTSQFTARYLRTREDFFARQLACIPFHAPPTTGDPYIEVIYLDGSRLISTVPALTSFLRYRSHILDLAALELHILSGKGQWKGVTTLLQLLFRPDDQSNEDVEDLTFRPFREVGQTHLRIIEIASSLSFDWSDSLVVAPTELRLLTNLNLQSCIRDSDTSGSVVDKSAVFSLLASTRRALNAQGRISTPADIEQLQLETAYVLESCAVENHRREIIHAAATGFEAWRRLLDVSLIKCFNRLPQANRENILFDLLHIMSTIIHSNNIQEPTAVLLAEVIVSVMTKLREDRRQQLLLQVADGMGPGGLLPTERLYGLLRNLADCILDKTRGELVRGNLYAAVVDYFHLIESADEDAQASVSSDADLAFIMSGHEVGSSRARSSRLASLQAGSFVIIKDVADQLVAHAARDAIDGAEVWKTVAFMLLDGLVKLSKDDPRNSVLAALVRHGVLTNFVHGLQQNDIKLQAVLKPDPDDLNPLYVYEAKMSMFIQIAQTVSGAERLVDVGIVPILAKCDYLDSRPESDHSFMDYDALLPSAIQRYHQVFMPALQLVSSVLATLGQDHASAGNQALEFLSNHRDTIVILLKHDAEFSALSIVDEVSLLVHLCAEVFPLVPKIDLQTSVSGFGAIHAAALSLAARTLALDAYGIVPQTESETRDSQIRVPGTTYSVFEARVRDKTQSLRDELVTYLGAASEYTEPKMALVLVALASPSHREDRVARVLAPAPTIGDALEALDAQTGLLAGALKKVTDLSAELASREHIRAEDVHELVDVPDAIFLDDLDVRQKKALIHYELGRLRAKTLHNARGFMNTLEMLLLLVWRHVAYYTSERGIDEGAELRSSLLRSTRIVTTDTQRVSFRAEVAARLRPILSKLTALEIEPDLLGNQWRANTAYLDIMHKRLRDAVGLQPEGPSRSGSVDSI